MGSIQAARSASFGQPGLSLSLCIDRALLKSEVKNVYNPLSLARSNFTAAEPELHRLDLSKGNSYSDHAFSLCHRGGCGRLGFHLQICCCHNRDHRHLHRIKLPT
jgi:hypothetical protein